MEGKRNKKQFEKISAYQRTSYDWKGDAWQPASYQTADEILGLSYENFKRTVIIPQGKFQEFLGLKPKERSQMLQELFHLKKYELSYPTAQLIRRNDSAIETETALLQQYIGIDEEIIKTTQNDINEQEAATLQLQQTLKLKQQELEKLEQVKQLKEKHLQLNRVKDRLDSEAAPYKVREERLQNYILCLDRFKSHFDKEQGLNTDLIQLEEKLKYQDSQRKGLLESLEKEEQTFKQVEEEYLQREQLQARAREFQKLLEYKEATNVLNTLSGRKEKGEQIVKETKQSLHQYKIEVEEIQQEIKASQKHRTDPQLLMELQDWYSQKSQWNRRSMEKEKQLNDVLAHIEIARREKKELLDKAEIDVRQRDLPTAKLGAIIEQDLEYLQLQKQKLLTEYEEWKISLELAKLADNLKEGEACPLCGALDHPRPLGDHHQGEGKGISGRIKSLEEKLLHRQTLLPQLKQLTGQAIKLGKQLKELQQEQAQLETEGQSLKVNFVWKDFDPERPEALEAVKQEIRLSEINTGLAEQKLEALKQNIQTEEEKLEKYRAILAQIQGDASQKEGELKGLAGSFQQLNIEEWLEKSDTFLSQSAVEAENRYQGITDLYKNLRENIEKKRKSLSELKGELSADDQRKQQIARQLATIKQGIEKSLEGTPFKKVEEIREILELPLNIDQERQFIQNYQREVSENAASIKEVQALLDQQSVKLEDYDALAEEIKALDRQLDTMTQALGGIKALLKQQEEALVQKTAHQKKLAVLEERKAQLKTLSMLFRGSGFVNYISTIYLENLCGLANKRFMQLTRNALSLEVDDQNQFLVRDRLNEGRLRSIHTLSGGQTFQAALCLALSLAEQVQEQATAKENFFFLDEGFGSQDKESLTTIFHTLKSLRKENRIVGVISHVEELQQEIDTYLYIRQDPEKGSQVHASWN